MTIENPDQSTIQHILKHSKRIAVIGLSNNPERTSYQVSKVMQQAGYKIIPVNPTIEEALGEKAVNSLEDIQEHVDIVDIFRRGEFLPDIARDFLKMDADVFWAQLGISNQEAYDILQDHGKTTVMDRCIKVEYQKLDA